MANRSTRSPLNWFRVARFNRCLATPACHQGGRPARSVRAAAGLILPLVLLLLITGCADLHRVGQPGHDPVVPTPVFASGSGVPAFHHVFVILMENHEYGQIVGNDDAPFINGLTRQFASAGRYYAIRHPSLPNYLALTSGSTQGMTYDCADCRFNAPNLVDQLEAHGKSWRSYQEDLPSPCFQGTQANTILGGVIGGGYVRRHDPFMYYDDIATRPNRCDHVVPFSQFAADAPANLLPDFVWITPSLRHDMHNGSVAEGDNWLSDVVPEILDSPAWKDNGVLFITWDEGTSDQGCCGNAAGGRVLTLVIGVNARRDFTSNVSYTHYSLLRTIEDAWNLGYLDHAGDPGTHSMDDFFHP